MPEVTDAEMVGIARRISPTLGDVLQRLVEEKDATLRSLSGRVSELAGTWLAGMHGDGGEFDRALEFCAKTLLDLMSGVGGEPGGLCLAFGGIMPDGRLRVCGKDRWHGDSHAFEFGLAEGLEGGSAANAEQLATVLAQIVDHSSDDAIRGHVRQVVAALRGDGLIILNGPPQETI
jgi:hypothetical protein